ncbi:branched-chain amino acid aminotransferase [Clostridium sp. DSM 8431]|uniref:aminotransferase class IV n=1 Tax=Clostridium sp. DSM 8431 TaxID=1761781 RepID=UPI0008EF8BE4|nr:aminotransferase class IV [Clostridium sp. DSM 8431]SFU52232.1 branched-chain amino acid aminotransferase [Clostridium sp. DSM 8431]
MKEAVNKFYIENTKVKSVDEWTDYEKGTVIYEVLKIINGKPLFYEEHYKRMLNSFNIKSVVLNISEGELLSYINKVAKINNVLNGNIKIIYIVEQKELRIYFIKHSYPTPEMYKEGVKCISYFAKRDNPSAKVINSKLREDVNNKLRIEKAYEAALVNDEGLITEGSRSNMFFIKENNIYTSEGKSVLPGVTRTEIFKQAKESKINLNEVKIPLININQYEAAFISGTSPNILPIQCIDDVRFNVNNLILRKIINDFNNRIEKYINK